MSLLAWIRLKGKKPRPLELSSISNESQWFYSTALLTRYSASVSQRRPLALFAGKHPKLQPWIGLRCNQQHPLAPFALKVSMLCLVMISFSETKIVCSWMYGLLQILRKRLRYLFWFGSMEVAMAFTMASRIFQRSLRQINIHLLALGSSIV